jgi:hypothetical protein
MSGYFVAQDAETSAIARIINRVFMVVPLIAAQDQSFLLNRSGSLVKRVSIKPD